MVDKNRKFRRANFIQVVNIIAVVVMFLVSLYNSYVASEFNKTSTRLDAIEAQIISFRLDVAKKDEEVSTKLAELTTRLMILNDEFTRSHNRGNSR